MIFLARMVQGYTCGKTTFDVNTVGKFLVFYLWSFHISRTEYLLIAVAKKNKLPCCFFSWAGCESDESASADGLY